MTNEEYTRQQFLRTMDDLYAWQVRQAEENVALGVALRANGNDTYHESRGISGEPSEKNRTYRVTESCWNYGLSNPRIAYTEDSDGNKNLATVRHTKNGVTKVVPHSEVRRKKVVKATVTDSRVALDRRLHQALGSNHENDV